MFTIAQKQTTAANMDRGKFEEYARKHYRQAYHLAFRMAGNESDAEDIVQEAFVKAYRFFDKYDPALPFGSWLYRIMTNVFIDEMRKRKRNRTISLDDPIQSEKGSTTLAWDIADPNADIESDIMNEVIDVDLQEALNRLSPDFRWAIVLADIEGLSYEEIADAMRCSLGTVRSRIHRARKQLRAYLEKIRPDLMPKS